MPDHSEPNQGSPNSDGSAKATALPNAGLRTASPHATQGPLTTSEARLEAAQAQVALGSWEIGSDYEPRYWSRQMFALFGFDPSRGIPSFAEFLARVHPDDKEQMVAAHRSAIQTGELTRLTYRSNPELGPVRYFLATAQSRYASDGSLDSITGTAQDVTATRAIEDALRLAQARLEAAQAQAHIGCWEFDIATQQISWSKEMYSLLRMPQDTPLPGAVWNERVHPDDLPEVHRVFAETLTTGEPRACDYRSRPEHGAIRHFTSTFHRVNDEAGRPLLVTGTLQDITERKRSELAIQDSERRLQRLLENSNDIIGVLDATGRALKLLGAVRNILGFEPAELEGRDLLQYVHPEHVTAARETITHAMAAPGHPQRLEYRARHKSGDWVEVEAVCASWLHEPSIHGIVFNIREVTDRKRAEQEQVKLQAQLQQAMKMEAVGRLAGGIAHDFNNLLTIISGNVELALSELDPSLPVSQFLGDVAKASASAASLTRQLLAFSRRQLVEPKVLNLNELIAQLHKMLHRLIGEDIALEMVLGEHLGLVLVDPGQFDQVIINLAVNARDAMPNGGRLTLETANVELDEFSCMQHADLRPGRYVMLAVIDNGEGMTAEVRNRIFEPFYTTKPAGQGTGLGLSMVFGAVKQAGGNVEVYSKVGQGTTFKIYLPRVETSNQQLTRPPSVAEALGGTETILIVEDHPSVRELTAQMLRRLGYHLLLARDGEEACVIARQPGVVIDLLLTDVVMPNMNGRELAEHIRLLHPRAAVLYCSGYTEDTIVRRGLMSENLHFIGKPFSLQELARKVRLALTYPSMGFAERSRSELES